MRQTEDKQSRYKNMDIIDEVKAGRHDFLGSWLP